jgi:hypothetical protein
MRPSIWTGLIRACNNLGIFFSFSGHFSILILKVLILTLQVLIFKIDIFKAKFEKCPGNEKNIQVVSRANWAGSNWRSHWSKFLCFMMALGLYLLRNILRKYYTLILERYKLHSHRVIWVAICVFDFGQLFVLYQHLTSNFYFFYTSFKYSLTFGTFFHYLSSYFHFSLSQISNKFS